MKKILSLIVLALFPVVAFSQQLPITSQYNYDLYQINPAAAGSMDYMPIALTVRKLWVGVPGSPSIQALSGHMKVADRMGVGAKLFNFMQGPLRHTGMEATYAYHIPLGGGDTKLAFGLTASLYQYYLNKQDLTMEDPSDPALLGGYKKVVPDANFGTLLYGKNYFVGLSIAQLFQGKINLGTEGIAEQKRVRHYFFNGGYNFMINDNFMLQPSVLLKFIEAGIFQADINARLTYMNMINFGLSYRINDALGIQIGYQNDNFLFGYAYDIALSDIRTQTSGSHEIIFMYKLNMSGK